LEILFLILRAAFYCRVQWDYFGA